MSVRILAECGSSHDGSLEKALDLVRVARDSGADYAKAQYWSSADRMAERRHAPQYRRVYADYQMPRAWLPRLARACEEAGIGFACSTYLPEDVTVVEDHTRVLKIASFEASDPVHLAAHVAPASRGHEILVSLGMGQTNAIAHHHLRWQGMSERTVRYLLCTSAYPCPPTMAHLARLRPDYASCAQRYDGLSDHTPPDCTVTGAVAVGAGATILERHIRLDSTLPKNPDYPHSCSPAQFAEYVRLVRLAETLIGEHVSGPVEAEQAMLAFKVS